MLTKDEFNNDKIRVLLVEECHSYRVELRLSLSKQPDFEVVAEATAGWQAIDLVKLHKPALVLCCLTLPDRDGISLTRQLVHQNSGLQVIILGDNDDYEFVSSAFQAHAAAYCSRSAGIEKILAMLRLVAQKPYGRVSSIKNKILAGI
jgi:DNA-binding NarL/FixJ family response regulator